MSLVGRGVGKHRKLARSLLKAGELEPRIFAGQIVFVRVQSIGVAALEVFKHGLTAFYIIDNDKAPRLTQADRRREARQFYQPLQGSWRQSVRSKPPYITTPGQKLAQPTPKCVIKNHH